MAQSGAEEFFSATGFSDLSIAGTGDGGTTEGTDEGTALRVAAGAAFTDGDTDGDTEGLTDAD